MPASARARVETLWRLDERLARLGASTSQFREVKLAWWEEQLAALTAAGHAEPLLGVVARDVLPILSGPDLARLADAWRFVEDEAVGPGYAPARGSLFAQTARLIGTDGPDPAAGELWAYADFRRRRPDLAQVKMRALPPGRWPRPLRALGALATLAERDVCAPALEAAPSARRVARMAWHRLSGL